MSARQRILGSTLRHNDAIAVDQIEVGCLAIVHPIFI
jgi:hypothetical protein